MIHRGRGVRSGRCIRATGLLAGLPLVLGIVGCESKSADAAVGVAAGLPSPTVIRGSFQSRVLLTGELQAIESVKIMVPRTPSWRMPIRWIEEDGAQVTQGQKVVELDNTEFSGDLEQKRLARSKALNDLMRKEADIAVDLSDKMFRLEQARVTHEKAVIDAEIPERLRSRREHQEMQLALSKTAVELEKAREDLVTSRDAADAELEELRLALEKAETEVRVAEDAIAALTLRAPRDGILVVAENRGEGRKLQTGDNVHVGMTVASIPDLSSMEVQARLSDVDDGKVTPGMRAACFLDTYPDEEFTGELTEIMPIAKEEGRESRRRAFRTVIRLHRTDPERMRPGMSVRVEVLPRPRDDVLLVPRAALRFGGEAPRAVLADGSSVPVTLGPCNAVECVVEQGLEEGQAVRTRG